MNAKASFLNPRVNRKKEKDKKSIVKLSKATDDRYAVIDQLRWIGKVNGNVQTLKIKELVSEARKLYFTESILLAVFFFFLWSLDSFGRTL